MSFIRLPRVMVSVPSLQRAFDRLADAIEWCCNLTAEAPLTVRWSATGPVIGLEAPLRKKIKLTSAAGTAGSYNAVEVYEAASGTWAVLSSGWSGVAWEYNLYASVTTPAYVTAEYCSASGDWRFQLGGCT